MVNKTYLIGNLGQDPELVTFDDGNGKLARMSLATSETFKNKAGEKTTETQWHRLVIYGKGAEIIDKYCQKGDRLFVEGQIKYRKYEDKEGETKYSTDIIVRDFKFLSTKAEGGSQKAEQPAGVTDEIDDDLPF